MREGKVLTQNSRKLGSDTLTHLPATMKITSMTSAPNDLMHTLITKWAPCEYLPIFENDGGGYVNLDVVG